MLNFAFLDDRIWVRNYEILEQADESKPSSLTVNLSLSEVGPRFCMQLIKVQERSFCGPMVYQNTLFQSPNVVRALAKQNESSKYFRRNATETARNDYAQENILPEDELNEMFA